MKWLNFKAGLIVLLLYPVGLVAQNRYEQHIERYKSSWEKVIPSYTKLQYAGGLGVVSFGFGWDYGKNEQWETDVMLGYIPKYSTKRAKIAFTVKQNFLPWNNRRINDIISIDPLSCSFAVNTVFDNEFWASEPDKYPSNYYNFSTKLRFWVGLGQRITFHIPEDKRFSAKAISLYYEFSTNDLYVVSAVNNSALTLKDYLKLAIGIKFHIF